MSIPTDHIPGTPIHENKQDANPETMLNDLPKHGPVRALQEELASKPVFQDVAVRKFADLLDRLFAEQGERIERLKQRVESGIRDIAQALEVVQRHHSGRLEKLEAKVDHLAEPLMRIASKRITELQSQHNLLMDKVEYVYENAKAFTKEYADAAKEEEGKLLKHIDGIDKRLDEHSAALHKLNHLANFEPGEWFSDFEIKWAQKIREIEKQISHLIDRLSMVHVQAQGDAKIRARPATPDEMMGRGISLPPDAQQDAPSVPWADLEAGNLRYDDIRRTHPVPEDAIPPDSAWQPEEQVKDDEEDNETEEPPPPRREQRIIYDRWITQPKDLAEGILFKPGDVLRINRHGMDVLEIGFHDLDITSVHPDSTVVSVCWSIERIMDRYYAVQREKREADERASDMRQKSAKSPARQRLDNLIAKEEADKHPNEKAIDAALRDAIMYGAGYLKIQPVNPAAMLQEEDEEEVVAEQPQPARVPYRIRGWAEERIAELKKFRTDFENLDYYPTYAQTLAMLDTHIAALDSEIGAETQPAEEPTVERVTISPHMIHPEASAKVRLDELDRMAKALNLSNDSYYLGSQLAYWMDKRRREIEEGR